MLSIKRKAIFFLILSLLLFFITFIFHSYYDELISDVNLTKKFQKRLLKKEVEVDDILSHTFDFIRTGESFPDFQTLSSRLADIDHNNVSICIFRSDSLVFWSDNNVQIYLFLR